MIRKLLFPTYITNNLTSLILLVFRIFFGSLFLWHGLTKWGNLEVLLTTGFPDPIGVGVEASIYLAIFGEVVCSLGLIFGVLTRLATLPMITTMSVAFFIVHQGDAFSHRELAFIYLFIFLFFLITGAGKYSVDHWIGNKIDHKRKSRRVTSKF